MDSDFEITYTFMNQPENEVDIKYIRERDRLYEALDLDNKIIIEPILEKLNDPELTQTLENAPQINKRLNTFIKNHQQRYRLMAKKQLLDECQKKRSLSESKLTKLQHSISQQCNDHLKEKFDEIIKPAKRLIRIQNFIAKHEQLLGVKLISKNETEKIIPHIGLKRLHKQGELRGALFEKNLWFYAQEDAERLAIEKTDQIERLARIKERREKERKQQEHERYLKLRYPLPDFEARAQNDIAQENASAVSLFYDRIRANFIWRMTVENEENIDDILLVKHILISFCKACEEQNVSKFVIDNCVIYEGWFQNQFSEWITIGIQGGQEHHFLLSMILKYFVSYDISTQILYQPPEKMIRPIGRIDNNRFTDKPVLRVI